MLPGDAPVLSCHQLVKSPEGDLRRQVPTQFAAEGALDGNGLKGELPDAGWNVAAASLACHHEGFAG
jgi:hypothetical protein